MTEVQIKDAVKSISTQITNAEKNPNIITGMQEIPKGQYEGSFELIDGIPSFQTPVIPGSDYKRCFVAMNLTHVETGEKENSIEVGYNSSLKKLLLNPKHWEQLFTCKTGERVSAKNNPYQVVIFSGVKE